MAGANVPEARSQSRRSTPRRAPFPEPPLVDRRETEARTPPARPDPAPARARRPGAGQGCRPSRFCSSGTRGALGAPAVGQGLPPSPLRSHAAASLRASDSPRRFPSPALPESPPQEGRRAGGDAWSGADETSSPRPPSRRTQPHGTALRLRPIATHHTLRARRRAWTRGGGGGGSGSHGGARATRGEGSDPWPYRRHGGGGGGAVTVCPIAPCRGGGGLGRGWTRSGGGGREVIFQI